MQLLEVNHPERIKLFLDLPARINKQNPAYIHPMNQDIESVFDKKLNPAFSQGKACRWILLHPDGTCIGRIAAFHHMDQQQQQQQAGCGFFECIDSQEAADMLFEQAKNWLAAQGLTQMDGPVNFGNRDQWWGLLIDGFHPPVYGMFYHPPYYQALFQQYGFQPLFWQYTFRRALHAPLSASLERRAARIMAQPDYQFADSRGLSTDSLAEQFLTIYNAAWQHMEGVNPLTLPQVQQLLAKLKPILDKKIIWFAYFKGQAIGFFVNIPDLNQLIVKFLRHGSLNIYQKFRLLYRKTWKQCPTMLGLVFGIHPDFQGRGVESALIFKFASQFREKRKSGYQEIQMNWIGSFNKPMLRVMQALDAECYKTHCTYRYTF